MDKRILIVDDDPFALKLLEKHLQSAGYEPVPASNAHDAMRILHNDGIQIIITDWMMPEVDGLQLCRAIRESEATGLVYIVVVTAEKESNRLVEAFDAGADDFLTKPYRPAELIARLKAGTRILRLEADLNKQNRAVHKANAELALLADKLDRAATTDELTGLSNRRHAMTRLNEEWALSSRRPQSLSCIMIDVDHFKKFNDTYGHEAGDDVLKHVSRVIKWGARAGEHAARLGGEEFVVLCPAESVTEAQSTAERIRRAVETTPILLNGAPVKVTISAGVAERKQTTRTVDELIRDSDAAMYEAKRSGRNRVCPAIGSPTEAAVQHSAAS